MSGLNEARVRELFKAMLEEFTSPEIEEAVEPAPEPSDKFSHDEVEEVETPVRDPRPVGVYPLKTGSGYEAQIKVYGITVRERYPDKDTAIAARNLAGRVREEMARACHHRHGSRTN